MNKTKTYNGGTQYENSGDVALDFFSKAGSIRDQGKGKKKATPYYVQEDIVKMFSKVVDTGDVETAFQLLFWLRDIRTGAGNRSGFRKCLAFIVNKYPEIVAKNLDLIIKYGRYDDLRGLFGSKITKDVVEIWGRKILEKDGLACKWADRSDTVLYHYMKRNLPTEISDIGSFRRYLAKNRKVVEQKMCSNTWNEVKYEQVPSKAMSMYTKAFGKHDAERFTSFKNLLKKEDSPIKINAGAIFPYDCAITALNGDAEIADAQFKALPNFMEESNDRIMCVCDSSGSMSSVVSGSVRAIHVSTSLSLYCSDRLGKTNPFYRTFLEFESEGKLKNWDDKSFSECYKNFGGYRSGFFNGAVGSTDIYKALMTILNFAKMLKATNDQIPTTLLIISDMQFDHGGVKETTPVKSAINEWVKSGYNAPKIVYWNVQGCAGSPDNKNAENVGLVSGFSPSILKSIFGAKDFTPFGIMKEALDKYEIKM